MKRLPECRLIETPRWFNNSAIARLLICMVIAGSGFCCGNARAQFSQRDQNSARSISGQFIVQRTFPLSRLANSPDVIADPKLIRIEPALLAVSAERIKDAIWSRLEIRSTPSWRGQIYLVIHPARSLDENVTIVARSLNGNWDYRVELPDVLSQTRLARALTGVLLLEYANRNAQAHSAEIPAWLTDGLSQELLAASSSKFILSTPGKIVNGLPVTRFNQNERGLDALVAARQVLKNSAALTFEQLSWPTSAQLEGDDGGVYRASAQVFTGSLLNLKNGLAGLRTMLESLPHFYNWQVAFQSVFRTDFPRPLDLEKWWALQVVSFAAHDPGARWTPVVSRARLDEILLVAVEMRTSSNSLPTHAEISFQTAIRSLDFARQSLIFQAKLRDLQLAQLRIAAPLAALTDDYRRTLAGYLGKPKARPLKSDARSTIKKLDALDVWRRAIEANLKPDQSVQPNLAPVKF